LNPRSLKLSATDIVVENNSLVKHLDIKSKKNSKLEVIAWQKPISFIVSVCLAQSAILKVLWFLLFREDIMTNKPRWAKVLASLIISMTAGATVLLALEDQSVPAGAFSLASYSRLGSVERIIATDSNGRKSLWNCIEIYYSKTAAGNIEQLASLTGLPSQDDVNFHFLLCNGQGGGDGQIEVTQRWCKQWSALPGGAWYGSGQTIRICLVGDGRNTPPTDCQIKRLSALVEALAIRFDIQAKHIYYPDNW